MLLLLLPRVYRHTTGHGDVEVGYTMMMITSIPPYAGATADGTFIASRWEWE